VTLTFTWPNKSISGRYRYTVHPDYNLLTAGDTLGLGYARSHFSPAAVIVADETTSGVYDTVYVDVDFNRDFSEKPMRKGSELSGADVVNASDVLGHDGVWDLSAGMLTWISDGVHVPPGVGVVYPRQARVPQAGAFISFVGDEDSHGTNCAGDIAAQGIIDDPQGLGPINTLFAGGSAVGGVGGPVLSGMARDAKIAAFQNGFSLPNDAWTLAVKGFDGVAQSGDEVQICSNSWGASGIIEDGWDDSSRFAQQLNVRIAPRTIFLVSTGNGGPGYGTVTSPSGGPILSVGASTSYGTLTLFELVTPAQFTWGEVQPWSNRGPVMTGQLAPHVVAVGARGTGADPLNLYLNGQAAYGDFGGTSMACPITAGVMALLYQAYKAAYGVYPTWLEARSILMNSCQDLHYEVLAQGAGNLNARRAVEIANRKALMIAPAEWRPGGYTGAEFAAYPSIMTEGTTSTKTFNVSNPTTGSLAATFQDREMILVRETTFTLTIPAGPPSAATYYPTYLRNITADLTGMDADMVRIQAAFPLTVLDTNGDYVVNNRWRMFLYDWTDRNSDGNLWTDTNSNSVVDTNEIDVDPISGIFEYNRISYSYPAGNCLEATIARDNIARRHDGLFLGFMRRDGNAALTVKVRMLFYRRQDWPWLRVTPSNLTVPAGTTATAQASLHVPQGTRPGSYQGALLAGDGSATSVIPIVLTVAATSTSFTFGAQSLTERPGLNPYDNSRVLGGFDWAWRYEAGDWRAYFYDVPSGTQTAGKCIFVDTRWPSAPTDVDTWVLGRWYDKYCLTDPAFFGPGGVQLVGGSEDTNVGNGVFLFNTNTSGPREVISAPVRDGLNVIALHNVLNAGADIDEPVVGRVWQAETTPSPVRAVGRSGAWAQRFVSGVDIPEGLRARAFGMGQWTATTGTVPQATSPEICTASWFDSRMLSNCGRFEVRTEAPHGVDIDLYVFRDGGNGVPDCGAGDDDLVGWSASYDSNEVVQLAFPPDGRHWVFVYGYLVPGGRSEFTLRYLIIQGNDLQTSAPSGPVTAGQPVVFDVQWSNLLSGIYEGLLTLGPTYAPRAVIVPVTINATPESASRRWILY
jgi:subtilisin family serine protease